MTCEELLKALNEYVDGQPMDLVCEEFAEHLAGCNPCQIVIDNIRQTISIYKSGLPFPMPADCQQKLEQALKAKWDAKFSAEVSSVNG